MRSFVMLTLRGPADSESGRVLRYPFVSLPQAQLGSEARSRQVVRAANGNGL